MLTARRQAVNVLSSLPAVFPMNPLRWSFRVSLVAGLHAPRGGGRWVYVGLLVLVALVGIGIAARHLWIQSLPPGQVPSCGAPLGYLLETRASNGGLVRVLLKVLSGSGE